METATQIQEFRYPLSGMPTPSIWRDIPNVECEARPENESISSIPSTPPPDHQEASSTQISAQDAEDAQRSFEAGRTQGIEEGRQLERQEHSNRLREIEENRIREAANFAEQVAHERDRFLHGLEGQVVKLSLSIASRILRHEAQVDPLFLSGAVRAALGQLAHTATVRLRVPAVDLELWSETIAHLPNLKVKPAVIADEAMRVGECLLQTDMGDADLGVDSQIMEITHGLLEEVPNNARHKDIRKASESVVSR